MRQRRSFIHYFRLVYFRSHRLRAKHLPIFPDRTWSGPFAFSMIFLGLLFQTIKFEDERILKGANFVLALVMLIGLGVYVNGYFALKNTYVSYLNRISIIEEAKSEGKTSVTIPIIREKSRMVTYQYYGDITEDSDYWLNHSMAEYYEFDTIIGQ